MNHVIALSIFKRPIAFARNIPAMLWPSHESIILRFVNNHNRCDRINQNDFS